MKKQSHPVIERLCYIAGIVRAGGSFRVDEVAAHFEVQTKTIYRDVEFLRDRLGYDLNYDRQAHGWRGLAPPPIL